MKNDPDETLMTSVIKYLSAEAADGSLPEWRQLRARALAERLKRVEAALAQTDREGAYVFPVTPN